MTKLQRLLAKLPTKSLHKIHQVLTEASLVYELGGDWQGVIKKSRYRAVGITRKILEYIEDSDDKIMDDVSKVFAESKII